MTPRTGQAGDVLSVEAVVTSTHALSVTVLLPFGDVRPLAGNATAGRLEMGRTVSWAGRVVPNTPVRITWTGRLLAAKEEELIALAQAPQLLPRPSNAVPVRF